MYKDKDICLMQFVQNQLWMKGTLKLKYLKIVPTCLVLNALYSKAEQLRNVI
jgi:hypothetical protein